MLFVSAFGHLHGNYSDETVFTRMNCDNMCQRTLSEIWSFITQTYQVSNLPAVIRPMYLMNFWRIMKYSSNQGCQNCLTSNWQIYQWHNNQLGWYMDEKPGSASRGWLMRKCRDIKASRPSSESDRGHKGREFKHTPTWTRIVEHSLKLILFSLTTFWKWRLIDFTAASQNPQKRRACSEIYFKAMALGRTEVKNVFLWLCLL